MVARPRAFGIGLMAVAVGLGALSFSLYFEASAEPALPSFDGTIAVATNDPKDLVELEAISADGGNSEADSQLRVLVHVNPAFDHAGDGLWVAVGLGGDAQPTADQVPVDGALPLGTPGSTDGFSVTGFAQGTAYFASQTSWPNHSADGSFDGQIVLGQPAECAADWCSIALTVPMTKSMVESTGARWSLSTPRLGRETDDEFKRNEMTLYSMVDSIASQRLESITDAEKWHLPSKPVFRFEMEGAQVADSVQQSGTSPVEPFGKLWQSSTPFEVDAFFERPRGAAQQDRLQFFAGVLVSLAGSLAVWGAELLLTRAPRGVGA